MATSTKTTDDAQRVYFTSQDDAIQLDDLINHQNRSFQWLVEEGLGELLAEISPIEDYTGTKSL
jgi:DNA-directed RNA polymerase subunit beta